MRADKVRCSKFASAFWDLEVYDGGTDREFATSISGPFQCDLAETDQRSLNDSYFLPQFGLLLDPAGNGDGIPNTVAFFISNSNNNQTGIFELEVTVEPTT